MLETVFQNSVIGLYVVLIIAVMLALIAIAIGIAVSVVYACAALVESFRDDIRSYRARRR